METTPTKISGFDLFPIENRDLYRFVLLNTLIASTAFTAINLILSEMDKGDAEDWKLKLMASWEKSMKEDFQEKLMALNNLEKNAQFDHIKLLPQPEEFQQEYNALMKDVKNMAVKALWPK